MSDLAPVEQQPAGVQSARPVVLVVDDDVDTVEELSDLVRSMGYPVRKARDPGLALNMVAESPDIGVVLLDLDVFIAGHAEGVVLEDVHAGEEVVQMCRDDILERHEALVIDAHEAGQ